MSILSPMPRGGKRPNSGRKPEDPSGETRALWTVRVTRDEKTFLKEALEHYRQAKKEKDSNES